MATEFSISSVTERDIDFLLLEEFVASPAFAKWILQQITDRLPADEPVLSAHRSVTTSSGESDLEIVVESLDGSVHYVLIENKVAAGFQSRQAERYRQRGDAYIRQELCDGYYSVLVAPAKYLGSESTLKGFDSSISYESIREWYASAAVADRRYAVKQELLLAAINKSSRGHQQVEDRPVSTFWDSYWAAATEIAPELQMDHPGAKPAGASFVYFRPQELPRQVSLVHKLTHGYADVQFAGMGPKLAELRAQFEGTLAPGMTIVRAAKSGVVRLRVPVLDTTMNYEDQKEDVMHGIMAARRLLEWYVDTVD